ncbi:hypothetical protein [Roseibium sp. RKSG952]|uniref:hypothetical protein n=1 Tax=Roseibium sp. RKSG952 TaxID=2529384 RepID=UPI0013C70FFC|nr:hypothetical protein [Roseibium sp. RKSG952]MTH99296.1 hypothetical protein [Roseibium sp. RKSG952]
MKASELFCPAPGAPAPTEVAAAPVPVFGVEELPELAFWSGLPAVAGCGGTVLVAVLPVSAAALPLEAVEGADAPEACGLAAPVAAVSSLPTGLAWGEDAAAPEVAVFSTGALLSAAAFSAADPLEGAEPRLSEPVSGTPEGGFASTFSGFKSIVTGRLDELPVCFVLFSDVVERADPEPDVFADPVFELVDFPEGSLSDAI